MEVAPSFSPPCGARTLRSGWSPSGHVAHSPQGPLAVRQTAAWPEEGDGTRCLLLEEGAASEAEEAVSILDAREYSLPGARDVQNSPSESQEPNSSRSTIAEVESTLESMQHAGACSTEKTSPGSSRLLLSSEGPQGTWQLGATPGPESALEDPLGSCSLGRSTTARTRSLPRSESAASSIVAQREALPNSHLLYPRSGSEGSRDLAYPGCATGISSQDDDADHVALQQLRRAVLGSVNGSRRHGRRRILFDVPDMGPTDASCQLERRKQVLGSRCGTPRKPRHLRLLDELEAALAVESCGLPAPGHLPSEAGAANSQGMPVMRKQEAIVRYRLSPRSFSEDGRDAALEAHTLPGEHEEQAPIAHHRRLSCSLVALPDLEEISAGGHVSRGREEARPLRLQGVGQPSTSQQGGRFCSQPMETKGNRRAVSRGCHVEGQGVAVEQGPARAPRPSTLMASLVSQSEPVLGLHSRGEAGSGSKQEEEEDRQGFMGKTEVGESPGSMPSEVRGSQRLLQLLLRRPVRGAVDMLPGLEEGREAGKHSPRVASSGALERLFRHGSVDTSAHFDGFSVTRVKSPKRWSLGRRACRNSDLKKLGARMDLDEQTSKYYEDD